MDESLKKVWEIASGGAHGLKLRKVAEGGISVPKNTPGLAPAPNMLIDAARKAIMDCIQASTGASLAESLEIQAKHSAGFMLTKACHKGAIGANASKMMNV